MATRHRAATLMSDGALQTLKLGMAMGMGERYVPEMADIVLALNDPREAADAKGLRRFVRCTHYAQRMHSAYAK